MTITITSWSGVEYDGIMLALWGTEMRVAVRGSDDALALTWAGGQWFAGPGDPVEVRVYGDEDDDAKEWQAWFGDERMDKALRLN